MIYKCPYCEVELEQLNYCASFSETSHGTSVGSYDFDNGASSNDTNITDSDNFEEYDYVYHCPECDEEIQSPEDCEFNEDEKEEIKKKPNIQLKNLINICKNKTL